MWLEKEGQRIMCVRLTGPYASGIRVTGAKSRPTHSVRLSRYKDMTSRSEKCCSLEYATNTSQNKT
jgi:hypothetical protein